MILRLYCPGPGWIIGLCRYPDQDLLKLDAIFRNRQGEDAV